MKYITNITLILVSFFFVGCEKVIDVGLETAAPKLVIDASIKWVKGTVGNEQTIKLSTTTGYYSNVAPTISGAQVFITNTDTNLIFDFIENPGTGNYVCNTFVPVLNANYSLTVIYAGQIYNAEEKLIPVPTIDKIEQKTNQGFNSLYYEIKAFYTDNGATDDFYLFRYKTNFDIIPSYEASEDEFYQGNQFFGLYINEDIKAGDNLDINIYGISQRYYDYMLKIISIAGGAGGSPFQTPPATVRGNIFNSTNEADFPLGYFNVSEVDFRNYVVQE